MVRWQNFLATIRAMATPEQRLVTDSARLFAASERYSAVLRRAIVSQSTMSAALEIPKVSGALKDMVRYEHHAGVTDLQSLLKEIMPTETVDPVRDFDKIGEFLAQQTAVNCERVIAAAVVVLSHSTADDVFTTEGLKENFRCAGTGDSRYIALSDCAANRRQVDREVANDGRGDLAGSHKADIANYLAPAPAFGAPGILPSLALSGAASAAISSRFFSQPAEEFSSLRFRKHLTEPFQGQEEGVRLALTSVRPR